MWIEDDNSPTDTTPESTSIDPSELTCQLCLNLFDIPLLLPCGHTICRSCVATLTEEETIICPTCNRLTVLEGNVSLKINYEISNQLDKIKQNVTNTPPATVQECDKCEIEKGTLKCSTCDIILCENCNKEHHRGKLRNHVISNDVDRFKQNRYCSIIGHEDYRLNLVGGNGDLICFLCCQQSDLQSQCISLQEATVSTKNSLSTWLCQSQQTKVDLQQKVSQIDVVINEIRESAQSEVQRIRHFITTLRTALDEKELALVDSISKHKNSQLKNLNVLREVVTSNISLLNIESTRVSTSIKTSDQLPDSDCFGAMRCQLMQLESISMSKLGSDMGLSAPLPSLVKPRVVFNDIDVENSASLTYDVILSEKIPRKSLTPSSSIATARPNDHQISYRSSRSRSPVKRTITPRKIGISKKSNRPSIRTSTPPGDIMAVQTKRHYPISRSLSTHNRDHKG